MLSRSLHIMMVVWLAWRELRGRGRGHPSSGLTRELRRGGAIALGMVLAAIAQTWILVWLLQTTVDAAAVPAALRPLTGHGTGEVVLAILLVPVALVLGIWVGLEGMRRLRFGRAAAGSHAPVPAMRARSGVGGDPPVPPSRSEGG